MFTISLLEIKFEEIAQIILKIMVWQKLKDVVF